MKAETKLKDPLSLKITPWISFIGFFVVWHVCFNDAFSVCRFKILFETV